jgi:pimeloyl-ACP methyl ester carboxylesterase
MVLAGTDPGGRRAIQPAPEVNDLLTNPNTTPDQLLPILFPADQQDAGYAWFKRIGAQSGLLPNSLTTTPELIAAQTIACARYDRSGRGTWKRLPGIGSPVLIGDGAEDVVVPTGNSRMLAKRIPGARLKIYPDAGHAFLIQEQEQFVPVVDRFLGP